MSVSTENEDDEMLFETSSAVEAEETPKILRASSSSEHSYVFSIAASNLPQPQDLNNPVDTRRNSFHEENYEEEGFVENSSEASLNRPNTPPCPCKSNSQHVLTKIESIFEDIADALLKKKQRLAIILKSRSNVARPRSENNTSPNPQSREVCFPGSNQREAWRFAVLVRILELVHDALSTDTIISKRAIYYRDPALFIKQAVVDRYVDDIAFTFGVTRDSLHIKAVAKGLVAGNLRILCEDVIIHDQTNNREGVLIPSLPKQDVLVTTGLRYIIVVEKEAIFKCIINSTQWDTMCQRRILITAKGYPDLSTRSFLHRLAFMKLLPPIKIIFLVDFDPDGLSIFSTYAFGSRSLPHETPSICLPLSALQYFGLKSQHLMKLITPTELISVNPLDDKLLFLSHRDRRKAISMLGSSVSVSEENVDGSKPLKQQLRRELQVMLNLGYKAELEVLSETIGGLGKWLLEALGEVSNDEQSFQN